MADFVNRRYPFCSDSDNSRDQVDFAGGSLRRHGVPPQDANERATGAWLEQGKCTHAGDCPGGPGYTSRGPVNAGSAARQLARHHRSTLWRLGPACRGLVLAAPGRPGNTAVPFRRPFCRPAIRKPGRNELPFVAPFRPPAATPHWIDLNGTDPVAYVLSANVHRRHLSKGQLAIAIARVCLENKQTLREAEKQSGVSNARIAQARTVLRYLPALAEAVLAGDRSTTPTARRGTPAASGCAPSAAPRDEEREARAG